MVHPPRLGASWPWRDCRAYSGKLAADRSPPHASNSSSMASNSAWRVACDRETPIKRNAQRNPDARCDDSRGPTALWWTAPVAASAHVARLVRCVPSPSHDNILLHNHAPAVLTEPSQSQQANRRPLTQHIACFHAHPIGTSCSASACRAYTQREQMWLPCLRKHGSAWGLALGARAMHADEPPSWPPP